MNSTENLMSHFCPFGYLDINTACEIGEQIGLYETQIFEIIDDFRESIGQDSFEHIDPVYCVMEHVLQHVRNMIEAEIGYDFINDFHGGTEIYTYGNFMCSSYDYSQEAVDELTEKLNAVSSDVAEIIASDKLFEYFLSELEIDIQGNQ